MGNPVSRGRRLERDARALAGRGNDSSRFFGWMPGLPGCSRLGAGLCSRPLMAVICIAALWGYGFSRCNLCAAEVSAIYGFAVRCLIVISVKNGCVCRGAELMVIEGRWDFCGKCFASNFK